MSLLNIKIDMAEITAYPPEEIVENLEKILESFHLKWINTNCYRVEAGFNEEEMIEGAISALQNTEWLKGAFHVRIERELIRYLLQAMNVQGMIPPAREKLEYYRDLFREKVLCEEVLDEKNPIVLDEHMKVVNGYVTYLVMLEQGYEFATCLQKKEISHFFH